jgi:hypothetical protein
MNDRDSQNELAHDVVFNIVGLPYVVKSTIGFTPFQLFYGLEAILLIECEIPSLKLSVELLPNTSTEKEHLLYLMQLDEAHHDATLVIEA